MQRRKYVNLLKRLLAYQKVLRTAPDTTHSIKLKLLDSGKVDVTFTETKAKEVKYNQTIQIDFTDLVIMQKLINVMKLIIIQ
jgi:hypothetical protein